MSPETLRLKNFQSHADSFLDFTKLDKISLIIGECFDTPEKSNGAGKSSIFDAVFWILFDETRVSKSRALTTDLLIRDGASEMLGEFVFRAKDNNKYRITKTFKRKTGPTQTEIKIEVQNGAKWKAIDVDGNKNTKKKIIDILGFDSSIYESTTLCKQHEVTGIATADSLERLALIKKLLKLDVYNQYAEQAKVKIDELKTVLAEVDLLKDKAEAASKALKEYKEKVSTETQKKDIQGRKIELQKKKIEALRVELTQLNKIIGAFDQLKETLKTQQQRRSTLSEEVKKIESKLTENKGKYEALSKEHKEKTDRIRIIDNTKPDRAKMAEEFKAASTLKSELQTKTGSIKGMLEAQVENGRATRDEFEAFKKLGIGSCPTCKGQVTEKHTEVVTANFEAKLEQIRDKARKLKAELDVNQTNLTVASERVDAVLKEQDRYNTLIQEKNTLGERLKAVSELVQSLQNSSKGLEENKKLLTDELVTLKTSIETTSKKLEEAGGTGVGSKHEGLTTQLKNENTILEECQQELTNITSLVNLYTSKITEAEAVITAYKEKEKGVVAIRESVFVYETLYKDFVRTIPTMIIENSAAVIESEVNRCLAALSDGFSIKIVTQHKNKTNDNIKEVFDIEVMCGDTPRPFVMLSGGEQFRVAFAIRVALSILLSQEAGIQMGAIFYDEPFNDLDEHGLSKIQEVFIYLSSMFEHQIAITHQNRLKDAFNDVVVVKKGIGGATICVGDQ